MLPSINKGVGMNLGFPDICVTPVGPVPVPVPYPNIAMSATAMPFAETVFLSFVPALMEISEIPLTLGDEAGTESPNSGPGRYTMGNPLVLIEEMPGICLLCPTTGNDFINPIGVVIVPSITTVFYTDATQGGAGGEEWARFGVTMQEGRVAHVARHSAADMAGLSIGDRPIQLEPRPDGTALLQRDGETLTLVPQRTRAPVTWRMAGRTAIVEVTAIPIDTAPRVRAAVEAALAAGATAVTLDLCGNGGGVFEAAVETAGLFLPRGATICRLRHADGDETVVRSRTAAPLDVALEVLVDGGTASSAEIVAAALDGNGRATLRGVRTYGKGIAAGRGIGRGGDPHQVTRIEVLRPDGAAIQGVGLTPSDRKGLQHAS